MNPKVRTFTNELASTLKPWWELIAYPFRLFTRKIIFEFYAFRCPDYFLSQPKLLQRLRNLRNGRKCCHIVCGGHSAPSTVVQIEDDDFVIGFGYAGLLDLKFDAYFFEVASTRNSWDRLVTRVFSCFYHHILRHRTKELFFKNYWNGRIDIDCLVTNFVPLPPISMDVHVPATKPYRNGIVNQIVCRSLLNSNSRSFSQAGGSVMTMIVLAIKSGAKEIVIHGMDLSGPHFYATPSWNVPKPLLDAGFRGIYPIQEDYKHPHLTKTASDALIPVIQNCSPGVEIRKAACGKVCA